MVLVRVLNEHATVGWAWAEARTAEVFVMNTHREMMVLLSCVWIVGRALTGVMMFAKSPGPWR